MLVALIAIVRRRWKRHRDEACGRVIGFWPRSPLGLAIPAVVASAGYVTRLGLALAVPRIDFGAVHPPDHQVEALLRVSTARHSEKLRGG